MSEHIVLLGAEEVSRAAYTIRDAAEQMSRVSGWNEENAQRQRVFMDEWLQRFEAAVDKLTAVNSQEPAE